ncbi:hypothetical protein Scep_004630 [Stephania cephalantha]|uniref:Uncharacterized protein n=1 Tax=Stephania cephalantha TaxID=152367 RepID=A0AAP0KT24_9MAGN
MRSAQDQRLADMTQSQERNMARILELMQQGNTGAAERAPKRNGPSSPFAPIHEDHPVEEGADSATAVAAAAVPVSVNKMERRWSSIAAAEEDCGESRPPLEEGGSGITVATAATHGGEAP